MRKNIVPIVSAVCLTVTACLSSPQSRAVSVPRSPAVPSATAPPAVVSVPAGFVPEYALKTAEQYKKDFLRQYAASASDLSYRFFYDENGNANLEYTVTPRGNYTWSQSTWTGYTWGNISGSIGLNTIRYVQTKQKADETQYRLEQRRKDAAFAAIEDVIYKIALETDYDYFGAFGMAVKYRAGVKRKAVCDGYADAVVAELRNHPLVRRVVKASSVRGNHAWNIVYLQDGRTLYCDSTWYDSNSIDSEGYVVHVPQRDGADLTFDVNEFNSLGGCDNSATGKTLQVHMAWPDVVLK
jgi:hypothetical protein